MWRRLLGQYCLRGVDFREQPPGVLHAQWLEDVASGVLRKRFGGHAFDEVAEQSKSDVTILPLLARLPRVEIAFLLVVAPAGREVFPEPRLQGNARIPAAVDIAVGGAVGDAGPMGEQQAKRDRRVGIERTSDGEWKERADVVVELELALLPQLHHSRRGHGF